MTGLATHIEDSFAQLRATPWLPGLTDQLANEGWQRLKRDIGLSVAYGTGRVLAGDPKDKCNVVTEISMRHCGDAASGEPTIVEKLADNILSRYENRGVNFYTVEELSNKDVLIRFVEAVEIIGRVPSLAQSVATVVRAIHVIKPDDDDCDVSFSEPHLPFSIFVSVPANRAPHDALRVAEAVVHEAMHLQLTLIELNAPLIAHSGKTYFSPWQDQHRTAQGVLHAIYVFKVIDVFLSALLEGDASAGWTSYVRERRSQIARQMLDVAGFQKCEDLTPLGATFVSRLLFSEARAIKAKNH